MSLSMGGLSTKPYAEFVLVFKESNSFSLIVLQNYTMVLETVVAVSGSIYLRAAFFYF